jgi:hypothetical protein
MTADDRMEGFIGEREPVGSSLHEVAIQLHIARPLSGNAEHMLREIKSGNPMT